MLHKGLRENDGKEKLKCTLTEMGALTMKQEKGNKLDKVKDQSSCSPGSHQALEKNSNTGHL